MRCDRCGYSVPEWLWLADDHPILVQTGVKIQNLEMIEQNIFRVSTAETVQIKMCSEVNHIQARQDVAKRRLEEAEANAKVVFHIPDWMCEKCTTQYTSDVPRINCCPTHNMVICYKCKDALHPEEIQKED